MTFCFNFRETLRGGILAGAVAALAALSSLPAPAVAQVKPPLTVAVGADVLTTNPFKISVGGDYIFFANVFEGLYGHDADGHLVPTLAETSKVSDDGLVYDIVLRPARFHNGDPVTAEDVRFSWQVGVDPKTGNARAAVLLANIQDIEVLGERQLRIHLKRRDAAMLENMELFFMIVPEQYFQKAGADGFAEKPVGTGPFAFEERRIGQYIKLRGFDGHWGRVPQVGDVTIKIVPQDQARVAQLQTGEADIVTAVPPALAPHLAAMGVQAITADSNANIYFAINTIGNRPDLKKVEVRRALNMAIDKPGLAKTVMQGYATVQELACNRLVVGCDQAPANPYTYDPKAAHEMLVKAGYDFSQPLKIVGLADGRYAESKATAEGVAYFLQQVGVKVDLEIEEFGAWAAIGNALGKHPDVDMCFIGYTDPNNDAASRLTKTMVTGAPASFYSDEDMDRRLAQMNDFTDTAQRAEFMRQIWTKIHDDAAFLTLWSDQAIYGARKNIVWKPTPVVSWPILWNVRKN